MYFNGLDEKESRISQSQDRITKLKLRIQELMKTLFPLPELPAINR